MRRTQLSSPPDPSAPVYSGNPTKWQAAAYDWMKRAKQQVEQDSQANTQPVGQFGVGTFTAVNTITGTDVVSNCLATLISALTSGGLLSTRKTQ